MKKPSPVLSYSPTSAPVVADILSHGVAKQHQHLREIAIFRRTPFRLVWRGAALDLPLHIALPHKQDHIVFYKSTAFLPHFSYT